MTAILGSGGYNYQTPTMRALGSITPESYDYRDQAKTTSKLVSDVSFMAGMMRKMQRGIDDANQNFVQQIQSLVTDIIVLLGGGGDTGLDFGDLKYVIQAIGALFGFTNEDGEIILPVNLFNAAWHFFSNYIGVTTNFEELINQIVDAAIATILDLFGEVPILGQALQQFAVIVSDIRDLLNPIAAAVQEFFDAFNIEISDLTGISGLFGPFAPIVDALIEALDGIVLPDFTPMFHEIAQWTTPIAVAIARVISVAAAFIKLILGTGTVTQLGDALKALSLSLDSTAGGGAGFGITDWATGFISNILNPAGGLISFIGSLIPGLDASKIVSGQLPQEMVSGLIEGLNQLYYSIQEAVIGLVSGESWQSLLDNIWGSSFSDGSTGHFVEDVLTAMQSIPGLNIVSTVLASIIPGIDASKITSGAFAQTQVTNLVSDLLAKLGINVFNASAQAGPNVVLGPGFEDSTIPRNYGGTTGSGYSTEQKHSGTQSFKIVCYGGWEEVDLIPVAGGTFAQDNSKAIKVTPGQKWYISVWCYAKSTNVGTNIAGLDVLFTDSSGVNPASYNVVGGALTTVTVGTWTHISGYITVFAGYDRMLPFFLTDNPTTAGNIWYVDDAEVYQDITPANSSGIQDILNGVTNFLTGLTGTLWGQTSANNALAGTKQSIEQNAAAIQAITTTSGGGAASGKSVVVNYNDYANGALPSTHTVAYFGTNASTVSILNGRVHANMVGGGDYKYWEILYNATQTNTDYQLVGITLTSLMGSGFGAQATNWIKARSNLAQSRYIDVEFRKDDFNNLYFRLQAVTASGTITWKDWTACPWATTAWLQCGTSGGARIYKVWMGNQVIWTHNEVGTLSDVGASNRYTGHGGIVLPTGPVGAGDVSQFAFYDNMPPATVGSGAIITRTATGSTQANAGATQYISNGDTFFNNIERKTDDITIDQVWGGFSVRDAGWYKVKASVKIAGAAYPDRIALRLLGASTTTPDQAKYGGRDHARMMSGGAVSTPPRWIADDWEVYLDANEYVYLGYDCAVLNVAGVFTGEATGLQSYFSIALINKNQN